MTVEDEAHKRPFPDASDTASSSKRPKPAVTEDGNSDAGEEDDVLHSWLTLEDEDVAQLMDFLSPSPPPASAASHQDDTPLLSSKVRFVENPLDDSRLEVIRSSSSFITIDLNEESCGSSFSEFESSVMASFDRSGSCVEGAAWVSNPSDRAFWYAWTGISSGGEEVVVSGGTQCVGVGVPELPWDGEGVEGFRLWEGDVNTAG